MNLFNKNVFVCIWNRGSIEGGIGNHAILDSLINSMHNLEAIEADLDMQLDYAKRNLRIVREDEVNRSFAYVSRDDLISVFGNDTAFTVPTHDGDMVIRKNQVNL